MLLPAMLFRQANAADAPALIALINAAFAVEKGKFKAQERITAGDELKGYLSRGTFLVAESGDEKREMLACVFVELLNPPAESRSGGVAYFGLLSVDPEHQRRGLGRVMTLRAEAWALAHGCRVME